MKILLVYPRYSDKSSSLAKLLKTKIPPLGLLYIGAVLEQNGHEVKIIDAEAEELDLKNICEIAQNYQPQLIGISTTTPTFKKTRETAKELKKILPKTSIIIGGPHLASFPVISLEFPEIDFGIIGEGEITICELINALEQKKDLKTIKGIVFKEKNQIIKTEERKMISDLDKAPLPAWHLIDLKKYQDAMSKKKHFAVMISSRGCPYNCLWCDPEGRFGKIFRARSPKNLIKEMDLLYNKHKIEEILFYDDTFTVNRQRIVDFYNLLINKNLKIIWECRTRVDLVDEELLKLMAQAGCYRIRFGVESGNEKILQFIRKGITKNQARQAFTWAKKYGIETFAYFMIGLPNETAKTMTETINFAIELNPDFVMFSPTLVFNKGNDLFKWASEKGYIKKDYWERLVRGENLDIFPILNTPEIPREKVLEYTKKAYRKFYFRPSFIFKTMKKINNFKKLIDYPLIALGLLSGNFKG